MYSFLNRLFQFKKSVKTPDPNAPKLKEATIKVDETGTKINALYDFPSLQILAEEMYEFVRESGGINFVRGEMHSKKYDEAMYFQVGFAERPDVMEIIAKMRSTLETIADPNDHTPSINLARATLLTLGYIKPVSYEENEDVE